MSSLAEATETPKAPGWRIIIHVSANGHTPTELLIAGRCVARLLNNPWPIDEHSGAVLDPDRYRGLNVLVVGRLGSGQWIANRLVGIAASVRFVADRDLHDIGCRDFSAVMDALPEWTPTTDEHEPQDPNSIFVPACGVTGEATVWLWDGWLPCGMLSLLVGDAGWGKSTLASWLAARVSRGELPGNVNQPGGVIYCTAEDAIQQVVRPRLEAAGAGLARVDLLRGELSIPDGLAAVEQRVAARGVKLVIFDPFIAYVKGASNVWNEQHVRAVLEGLRSMAERQSCAVVLVVHFNKKLAKDLAVVVGNSKGFFNVARSVLVMAEHPNKGSNRVVIHGKCNVGPLHRTTAWTIEGAALGNVATSRISPTGAEVDYTATDYLNARAAGAEGERDERRGGRSEKATDFLLGLLANGPVDAELGWTKAQEAGVSKYGIEVAKRRLGVVSVKAQTEDGGWQWILGSKNPTNTPTPAI